MNKRYLKPILLFAVLTMGASAVLEAEEILLFDDFNNPPLDNATWGLANWNIGDRTQFGNQPVFATSNGTSFITLPLDTWNPNSPGDRVFGTEIYSLENFSSSDGIEYLARARLGSETPGLVAAFFTYNQQRRKGKWISDEIDFEVLSKQPLNQVLVTSWNDWGATGSDYGDGVHHLGAFLDLPAYDWRQWNDYAMRWYPDRVEWYVNDVLIRTHSSPVPDMAQPVRASLWAGGSTWPDAFDAALAPVADAQLNERHEWQVDYIMVTRLGGSGGGNGPLSPSGLAASVNGSSVTLGWTDESSDEDGFNVYRAWKPKGKAAPDFSLIATTDPDVYVFGDSVQDGDHLYYVTAFNSMGESAASNQVEVKVGSGGKGGGKPKK